MAFEKIMDPSVKNLAKTLLSNGLASSETQAIEMAQGMVVTERKIQADFDDQKPFVEEKPVLSSDQNVSEQDSESIEEKDFASQVTTDLIKDAVQKQKESSCADLGIARTARLFEEENGVSSSEGVMKESVVDNNHELDSDKPLKDLMDEDAAQIYGSPDTFKEPVVSSDGDITISDASDESFSSSNNMNWSSDNSDFEIKKSVVEKEKDSELESDESDKTDETDESNVSDEPADEESKKSDEKKSKKVDDCPESTIDLSDVFNFGKK
ncbi:MAG: hypothetical protein ABIC91_06755 [Nanoarchaeota archaeon]|nr:hypothetical protein [Nanoarchaeota archaeon]MBU1029694.1 hypothetical protein [Nanoarchaeota archaeon]MBU1849708.1 hypothetical protein [Nanoarchaeota archaeon]